MGEAVRIVRPPTRPALCGCQHETSPTPCSTCSTDDVRAAAATEPLDSPFPRPDYVPADWFFEKPPGFERGQGLTIYDDGRAAFYFHEGGCMIGLPGYPDKCTAPTPSPTGYAAFHQQDEVVAGGSTVRVGAVPLRHASPYVGIREARNHYDDPTMQRLIVRAYDDIDERGQYHGSYGLGAVVPTIAGRRITYGDVAELRRCGTSGDWREFDREWFERAGVPRAAAVAVQYYDCLGPVVVTRPGLPLVRAYRVQDTTRAAAAGPVLLGGLGGIDLDDGERGYPDAATSTAGGAVQPITLSDGTILEVPDGATINTRDGGISITLPTAAQAAAGDGPPFGKGEKDGEKPEGDDDGGSVEERVAKLEEDVADIKRMLSEASEAAQAAAQASADAVLAELDRKVPAKL